MPLFNYEAYDNEGKRIRGAIYSENIIEARMKIRSQSLHPIDIQVNRNKTDWLSTLRQNNYINQKKLTNVTRQLATMLNSGITLEEALKAISDFNDNPKVQKILSNLRGQVIEGEKLSDAMYSEKKTFNNLYRSLIAAGEASGNLGPVTEKIAEYLEKSEKIKSQVLSALIYPLVLSFVAISVICILLVFVIPKISEQFINSDLSLPVITKFIISLSAIIINSWHLILMFLVVTILLVIQILKKPDIREKFDSHLLEIPYLGSLIILSSSAKFARTLGTLLEGGSPLLESLAAVKENQNNIKIRKSIDGIYLKVREGISFSKAISSHDEFNSMLLYMISMGEKTGTLPDLLIKTAEHLEDELDRKSKILINLFEPLIILIMGVIIGLIVMSIMLPIMELNNVIIS